MAVSCVMLQDGKTCALLIMSTVPPNSHARAICFLHASKEGAEVVEQILDESDAVGLMQLQCKEAKDDASAMIFPTTDTLSLQQQVSSQ